MTELSSEQKVVLDLFVKELRSLAPHLKYKFYEEYCPVDQCDQWIFEINCYLAPDINLFESLGEQVFEKTEAIFPGFVTFYNPPLVL